MKFKTLVWLMGDYESGVKKMEYLDTTADYYDYEIDLMGVHEDFIDFRQKLTVLEKALINVDDDTIVLCMDAWDTLFNAPKDILVERFLSKSTGILMSAEKIYTYQYHQYKHIYDDIESDYRYLNAGTFMGYAGAIKLMIEDCKVIYEEWKATVDQGLMGIWTADNLDDKSLVQLDSNCDIFWVTSKDWDALNQSALRESIIFNPYTFTIPSVIHNVGNATNMNAYRSAYINIKGRYLANKIKVN